MTNDEIEPGDWVGYRHEQYHQPGKVVSVKDGRALVEYHSYEFIPVRDLMIVDPNEDPDDV